MEKILKTKVFKNNLKKLIKESMQMVQNQRSMLMLVRTKKTEENDLFNINDLS
jgi:hypothetical protein